MCFLSLAGIKYQTSSTAPATMLIGRRSALILEHTDLQMALAEKDASFSPSTLSEDAKQLQTGRPLANSNQTSWF